MEPPWRLVHSLGCRSHSSLPLPALYPSLVTVNYCQNQNHEVFIFWPPSMSPMGRSKQETSWQRHMGNVVFRFPNPAVVSKEQNMGIEAHQKNKQPFGYSVFKHTVLSTFELPHNSDNYFTLPRNMKTMNILYFSSIVPREYK